MMFGICQMVMKNKNGGVKMSNVYDEENLDEQSEFEDGDEDVDEDNTFSISDDEILEITELVSEIEVNLERIKCIIGMN